MSEMILHLEKVVQKTWNFAGRLKSPQDHEQNALVGLAAEAGEVLDEGKKRWFHTPRADGRLENIKSELGDVIYYWLKALDVYGFTIEEVLEANREKLASRHPELGKVQERFADGYIK